MTWLIKKLPVLVGGNEASSKDDNTIEMFTGVSTVVLTSVLTYTCDTDNRLLPNKIQCKFGSRSTDHEAQPENENLSGGASNLLQKLHLSTFASKITVNVNVKIWAQSQNHDFLEHENGILEIPA